MIALEAVSKVFRSAGGRKTVTALADFSLTIAPGEVLGVAGPNGAGKSTMISLILGYLEPTSGTVRLQGLPPRAYVQSRGVSYLTEVVALPPRWTVESTLRRLLTLAGAGFAQPAERIDHAIAAAGLEEHRRKQVRQLSKGTLQRLGLAQSLLDDSDVVILDEPTHGLDPVWTQRFRDVVRDLRRPGRAVVVASHNLDELERIADRVAILHQGRLQRVVVPGQAREGAGVWRVVLAEGAPEGALLAAFPDAVSVEGRAREYRVRGDLDAVNAGLARLLVTGARVAGFFAEQSRLEREFHAAVGEDPEPPAP
ncbi:MAG: ABC transporter ATP-binding protein [Gemmatimonadales bacterium]